MCACLVVIHTAHVLVPVLGTQYCYHHCYLQPQCFHFYCIHHFQHLCDLLPLQSHHHLRLKSVLLVKIVHSHHHLRLKSVLVVKIELMVHSHRHLHLKSVLLVKIGANDAGGVSSIKICCLVCSLYRNCEFFATLIVTSSTLEAK